MFVTVWRHFGCDNAGVGWVGGSWNLVDGSLRCCQPSYNAEDSIYNKEFSDLKMLLVLRLKNFGKGGYLFQNFVLKRIGKSKGGSNNYTFLLSL